MVCLTFSENKKNPPHFTYKVPRVVRKVSVKQGDKVQPMLIP